MPATHKLAYEQRHANMVAYGGAHAERLVQVEPTYLSRYAA